MPDYDDVTDYSVVQEVHYDDAEGEVFVAPYPVTVAETQFSDAEGEVFETASYAGLTAPPLVAADVTEAAPTGAASVVTFAEHAGLEIVASPRTGPFANPPRSWTGSSR